MVALEPRTLELVRRHRRYLMQRNHPGIETGLLFPSEAGTRPIGNDQLNDVWREVQVMAESEPPVTIHGIRHSFHDLARQQRSCSGASCLGDPGVRAMSHAIRPTWRMTRGSRTDVRHPDRHRKVSIWKRPTAICLAPTSSPVTHGSAGRRPLPGSMRSTGETRRAGQRLRLSHQQSGQSIRRGQDRHRPRASALLPGRRGSRDRPCSARAVAELTGELWIITHADLKATARVRTFRPLPSLFQQRKEVQHDSLRSALTSLGMALPRRYGSATAWWAGASRPSRITHSIDELVRSPPRRTAAWRQSPSASATRD